MIASALIVDDSSTARRLLRSFFQACSPSTQCFEASNAAEALAFLRQRPVDVLLLDVQMPGQDGLSFAEHLATRAKDFKPTIIVLMSGSVTTETETRARQGGHVYELLRKPFAEAAFRDLVARLAEIRRPRQALVVDDSATVRKIVGRVLEASVFNVAVETKADGPAMLAALNGARYDVLFVDRHMPGLDGIEAGRQALRRQPDLKVVLISTEADADALEHAAHAGIRHFLKKPFFPADVDRVLHELFALDAPALARPAVARGSSPPPADGGSDAFFI